jgi:farnesyl diphosphate synthase/geranylgeranyl diphosphate synthase type II
LRKESNNDRRNGQRACRAAGGGRIRGDLLDLTATTADLGKRAGKDAEAGKATLPAILGVEEARRRAHDYCEEALQAFAGLGEGAAALRALARFVVSRRK